ncbi:MAG: hypothetical protein HQL51_11655 [Magnetococcales bacterium]|nr:hypothetical protein [Magnetococcales bacterium]
MREDSDTDPFIKVRKIILKWIEKRSGRKLPKDAWDGRSFDLDEVGAQRTSAVAIDEPRYWAARLDDADKNVPQRIWTTEISIWERQDRTVVLGVRLLCITHGDDVPFERTVPRFVRDIVDQFNVELDGRDVSTRPWLVDNDAKVEELVSLLGNPSRLCDVLVFSLPDGSIDPSQSVIRSDDVARKIAGAAHVVVLTGPASYILTGRVGKELSVYRQAVRTYRPGFNLDTDEPFRHPMALPQRVNDWPEGGQKGFENFLVSQSLMRSVTSRGEERRIPPFAEVRRIAYKINLKHSRESGTSDTELLAISLDENKHLQEEYEAYVTLSESSLKTAEDERDQNLEEAQQLRLTNLHLRRRIEELEKQVTTKSGTVKTKIPVHLESFSEWCQTNLGGAVEIHSRALKGIKKSEYEDVHFIYDVLLFIRDYYVPMRREGGQDRRDAYNKQMQKLGLEEEKSISRERIGEQGDTYRVSYGGRKRLLEDHLKKGNSREQRKCFRIYYFWDDINQQVVVGWLPSHLDTRAT